jgi:hypothetical protein
VSSIEEPGPLCKQCKQPITDASDGFCERPGDPCWKAWATSDLETPTEQEARHRRDLAKAREESMEDSLFDEGSTDAPVARQTLRFIIEDGNGEALIGPGDRPIIIEAVDGNAAVDALRRWVTRLKLKQLEPGEYLCRGCRKPVAGREMCCSSRCDGT